MKKYFVVKKSHYLPVLPKPPKPLSESESFSTSLKPIIGYGKIINCAILSPGTYTHTPLSFNFLNLTFIYLQ